MSVSLDGIALKYRVTKGSFYHDYMPVYERYISGISQEATDILEIGIDEGRSLKMWAEYFPNAIIHGVDILPKCKAYEECRIKVYIGSQDDEKFIKESFGDKKFDLIIDDASHLSHQQIATFHLLFDNVKPGGYYVIEDVCCSYWESFGGGLKKQNTAVEYFKDKIDDVNYFGFITDSYERRRDYILSIKKDLSYFEKNVKSLHFHNSMIIIEKY
jgi:hypothetical protein